MTHQIQFVYFDVGNVLLDYSNAASPFAKEVGTSCEKILDAWNRHYEDGMTGKIDTKTFWGKVLQDSGSEFCDEIDYCDLWNSGCKKISRAHEVFLRVQQDFEVGYFTDTINGFMTSAHERTLIPSMNVKSIIESWQIGMTKTNKGSYKYAERELDFKPDEILLIDDKKEIVEVAKGVGWNAVSTIGELESILYRSAFSLCK